MPTWAAVVLPIVVGVIGVLGTLLGTWLGGRQAREQERRRILGDAANRFAEKIGGATNAVGLAVAAGQPSGRLVDDAVYYTDEALGVIAPVELHFDTATGRAARESAQELRATMEALKASDPAAARGAFGRAAARRESFYRSARAAIWGEEGGSGRGPGAGG